MLLKQPRHGLMHDLRQLSCVAPGVHSQAVKAALLTAVLVLTATLAHAGGQHVIPNYATAHRQFFWTQLYVNGGESLYYGRPLQTGPVGKPVS